MARWEPNAHERLQAAAMALFEERGYDRTTVGDIATRAGLTDRTFFRYFSDKREVLFARSEEFEKGIIDIVANFPEDGSPLAAVAAAFEAAGTTLQNGVEFRHIRARHLLVMQHAELRERELIKLASVMAAVVEMLRERGVSEPAASLAAEAGLAVFKVAFERWINQKKPQKFATPFRASLAALKAVTGHSEAPSVPLKKKPVRRR